MYNVTELIAEWDKNNHKRILSTLVDRKNHSFNTLKELALFSRSHYIFTSYQKESEQEYRNSEVGKELYTGNNLLWIDLDCKVYLEELREKMIEHNLLGFAYYSSAFYDSKKKHVRLCIILEKPLEKDELSQAKYFAQEIVNLLGLDYTVDPKIYGFSSYLAIVKHPLEERQFFITKGKPYKIIHRKIILEKFNKADTREQRRMTKKSRYSDLLPFLNLLHSMPEIEEAIPRNKGTISVSFKSIPEKTKNGYYIDPLDPWYVYHPNKEKKIIYINTVLKESFEKYKNYCLAHLPIKDEFKDYLKPDLSICVPFIPASLFEIDESLIFIESSTGSGKTTAVSNFFKSNKDKSVLFISVNRMQAVATKSSLLKNKLDFECYLTASPEEYKSNDANYSMYNKNLFRQIRSNKCPNNLILGILSLYKLIKEGKLLKKFDYIVIDEITTLPNNTSNALDLVVDKFSKYEQSMEALSLLLNNSEKIICMDGFISKPIIKLFERITSRKAYVIQNTQSVSKNIEIYCSKQTEPRLASSKKITCVKYFNQLYNDLKNASFKNNNTVMIIALSNKALSNMIYNFIKQDEELKHKKVALFNKDITKKDGSKVIKMFENFKKSVEENSLDICIYSPTVVTGIDIPQAEGTHVYHIINGDHLSAHTNYQMTMRGRKAETYRILIPKNMFMHKTNEVNENLNTRINSFLKKRLYSEDDGVSAILSRARKKHCNFSGTIMCYLALENAKLSNNFLSDVKSLDRPGLLTALLLDNAMVNFQRDCNVYADTIPHQYLNFLRHEGCKISIEEDIEEDYHYTYKTDIEKYYDKFKDINYTLLDSPSVATLYSRYKKIVFVQQILLGYKRKNIPEDISNAVNTMQEMFKQYSYGIAKYLKNESFTIPYSELGNIYMYFFNSKNIEYFKSYTVKENRTRLTIAFLKRMFKVRPVRSDHTKIYDYIEVTPKTDILESIENVTDEHLKVLFVTKNL